MSPEEDPSTVVVSEWPGGQEISRERRTVRVQVELQLDPPYGGDDLAAVLAFREGADLAAYVATEMRRSTLFLVDLAVPAQWTDQNRDRFAADLAKALRYSRGMPWLGPRETLAYMAAEDAVARLPDAEVSEMFSMLRRADRNGWDDILRPLAERVKPYAEESGKQAVAALALASLRSLAHLLGIGV